MMSMWKILSIGIIIGLFASGLVLLVSKGANYSPFELQPIPPSEPLVIHIIGEVNSPGVYRVPVNSRVIDVVESAGGFADNADRNALNLSQIVSDGQQINIPPKIGGISISVDPPDFETGDREEAQIGTVNINTSGIDELSSLPGIGPVSAANIIDYRQTHGPFTSIDELLSVKGIGVATFEEIKYFITIR